MPSQPHTGSTTSGQSMGRNSHIPLPSQLPVALAQYIVPPQKALVVHSIVPTSHLPPVMRLTPAIAAKHGFWYVMPSQPHTGSKKLPSHSTGRGVQRPRPPQKPSRKEQ